jgi:predicted PurR-regulated permease PerM
MPDLAPKTAADDRSLAARPRRSPDPAGFFKWLPWEKFTIWGLFLFLVYALRQFFLIIFLTFIFSYVMTSIVRRIMKVISPGKDLPWLHRGLVVVTFGLLLGSLVGLGVFLKEPLKEQIVSLKVQINNLELHPQTLWDDLARNTIGKWKYEKLYTGPDGKKRREEDLQSFREEKYKTEELKRFKDLQERVSVNFEKFVIKEKGEAAFQALEGQGLAKLNERLKSWIEEIRSPTIYTEEKPKWDQKFDEYYAATYGDTTPLHEDKRTLVELKMDTKLYEGEKLPWVYSRIAIDLINNPKELETLKVEFRSYLGERSLVDLRASGRLTEEFQPFYEKFTELDPDRILFDKFTALREALSKGEEEFHLVLLGDRDPKTQEADVERSFRRTMQAQFAQETLEDLKFLHLDDIRARLQAELPQRLLAVGDFFFGAFQFVVYFALSLMLSLFITFDLPRIKAGIQRLGESHVRELYHEIAPGLAAFGSLIGRAFQAQGVIAICNTLLTLGLIKALDIPYAIFLCTIVFICSFIPVLGVVLSTVPIALVALLYKDTGTALMSIGGVLLIHFIETSILNPKILGEMLHLHPVLVLGILVVGEHFFHVWGLLLGVPVMVYIIRYVILKGEKLPGIRKEAVVEAAAAAAPAAGAEPPATQDLRAGAGKAERVERPEKERVKSGSSAGREAKVGGGAQE